MAKFGTKYIRQVEDVIRRVLAALATVGSVSLPLSRSSGAARCNTCPVHDVVWSYSRYPYRGSEPFSDFSLSLTAYGLTLRVIR